MFLAGDVVPHLIVLGGIDASQAEFRLISISYRCGDPVEALTETGRQ
jgi:hypothetical protein